MQETLVERYSRLSEELGAKQAEIARLTETLRHEAQALKSELEGLGLLLECDECDAREIVPGLRHDSDVPQASQLPTGWELASVCCDRCCWGVVCPQHATGAKPEHERCSNDR
jgi:hypothetical protein